MIGDFSQPENTVQSDKNQFTNSQWGELEMKAVSLTLKGSILRILKKCQANYCFRVPANGN